MSWPAKTWVPDELVTAASLNQWLRDPLADLSGHVHNGAAGAGAADLAPTTITMGGALYQRRGADVASASALPIGTDGNYFNVTGTTGIASITSRAAGTVIILRFNSALTVGHGGGITLQGGANWAAAAGSLLTLVSHAANDWREVSRWALQTLTSGYIWVLPDNVDGADRSAAFGTAAGYTVFNGTTAVWQFGVPADYATLISATEYFVSGGTLQTANAAGGLTGMTPGGVGKYTGTHSVGFVGLAIRYTA